MGAAARNKVHIGVKILKGKAFLVGSGGAVNAEIGRSGVVDAAGYRNAGFHAFYALRPLEVGFHLLAVRSKADVAVFGLFTVGKGSAAGAGIGDELVGGIGAGIACHGHLVDIQGAAIGHPTHRPLSEAGAVADHEDYVLHPLAAGLLHLHCLVGSLHFVAVVLGEGVGGIFGTVPVQGIGSLGIKADGTEGQEYGNQSFHYSASLAFHPEKVIRAFADDGSTHFTVRLSPGAREKKLSLQKAPGMRFPSASRALRIF